MNFPKWPATNQIVSPVTVYVEKEVEQDGDGLS